MVSEESDITESLRSILTSQQEREVSYEEARDIGAELLGFFEALAGE